MKNSGINWRSKFTISRIFLVVLGLIFTFFISLQIQYLRSWFLNDRCNSGCFWVEVIQQFSWHSLHHNFKCLGIKKSNQITTFYILLLLINFNIFAWIFPAIFYFSYFSFLFWARQSDYFTLFQNWNLAHHCIVKTKQF